MLGRAVLILSLSGCNAADPLAAALRFEGADYVFGALPPPGGGPSLVSLETSRALIRPGERDHPVRGAMAKTAEAALIGRAGDPGYWIVVAGPPDAFSPDLRVLDARAELAHDASAGPLVIEASATDATGAVGERRTLELRVEAEAPDDAPLRVTLTWDGAADLDLRVVDPAGVEIGGRNPNSWSPPLPSEPLDPGGFMRGAVLEVDTQAGCTTSVPRRERVRWPVAPAAGEYVVRVDTFSLCGDAVARWSVVMTRMGVVIGEAEGVSTSLDTRFSHDRGAGVVTLAVTVP